MQKFSKRARLIVVVRVTAPVAVLDVVGFIFAKDIYYSVGVFNVPTTRQILLSSCDSPNW